MEHATRALLLTDVVDSTRLSEELGDAAMAELWAKHDRVARDMLPEHHGREIDKTDGFLLLFDDAADAVAYAVAYHRALTDLGIAARAGLHVGEVILTENDPADIARGAKPLEVDGIAKPIAARVMSAAIGGQTLLTAAAIEALGDIGLRVRSHGHWRMKGVAEPLELFEVGDDDAPFEPPPDGGKVYRVVKKGGLWVPVREVKHSLPAERDAFVGRSASLQTLERLLRESRLVSVLGIGGTGKTRLVTRFGWIWLGDWPGGVWFCDLSEARSVDGIAHAVARALDVRLGKNDSVTQLGHAIAGRGRCLVLLDNFEQVARHAPDTLGRWLDRAHEAKFVVTSREVLGLRGEATLSLAPLEAAEAVDLFAARARHAKQGFTLEAADPDDVYALVALLDHLPLAIELAAARVRVMSPSKLLDRMSQRFRLLTSAGGRRNRQATLRATLDWSWDLLSADEQAALAQFSVFEGGFTLEAAEAVLDLEELWSEDAVQALVDKSLVRARSDDRFDLLVSVQEYAAEKLDQLNTTGAAHRRHGEYFAAFGSDAAWQARAADGAVMRRSLRDLDNVVVACRRAISRADAEVAVQTLGATWTLLRMNGPIGIFPELGEAVVAMPLAGRARSAATRCLALGLSAVGRVAEARARFVEAREAAQSSGDRLGTAKADKDLGFLLLQIGESDAAARHLESAAAAAHELGHPRVEAHALANLALTYQELGEIDRARAAYEAALRLRRKTRDRYGEGVVLSNLGNFEVGKGRVEAGRRALEQALAVAKEVGNRTSEGHVRVNLGGLAADEGNLELAEAHFREGLAIHREAGHRYGELTAIANLASLLGELGRSKEALAGQHAALEIAREIGSRPIEGQILDNLGELLLRTAQPNEARTHYERALDILREVAIPHLTGRALGGLGLTYARLGRMQEAREAFDQGSALLAPTGEQFELGQLWARRALFEVLDARYADAQDWLTRAQRLADTLGVGADSLMARQIEEARAELAARTTEDRKHWSGAAGR